MREGVYIQLLCMVPAMKAAAKAAGVSIMAFVVEATDEQLQDAMNGILPKSWRPSARISNRRKAAMTRAQRREKTGRFVPMTPSEKERFRALAGNLALTEEQQRERWQHHNS